MINKILYIDIFPDSSIIKLLQKVSIFKTKTSCFGAERLS